jgi:hypothetical protein
VLPPVGGGDVGVALVLFVILPRFIAIIIGLPLVIFSLALAFYRINDKPFVNVVEAFVKYALTNKLYIWKKENKAPVSKGAAQNKPLEQVYVPKLSDSKLKELTWSLDIKETENSPTKNTNDGL